MHWTHLVVLAVLLIVAIDSTSAGTDPRIDRIINDQWKFTRSDPVGAAAVRFDDARWMPVTLPHTWNALDGQDGGNDYYRGTGWYRKVLTLEETLRSKHVFLRFEAASLVTTVYVNGTEVGTHKGGFAAFCFDITPFAKFGRSNVIAVRVNNARNPDVTPLSGDFTVFGGIYRNVHLLILDPLSVTPLDHASSGIYLTQKAIDHSMAKVEVIAMVRNEDEHVRTATIQWSVLGKAGNVVARRDSTFTIDSLTTSALRGELAIATPHLWQGKTNPYLYTVRTEVIVDGKILDRVDQPLGLRRYTVDPDRGFFLNGTSYPLHGVNRHQDRLNMGWAITEKEQKEDYGLIDELGCTVVRLAHYQHAQAFYDLCDKGGMVAWAELALVDRVTESQQFVDNCKQQLTELILQNYNHPSICFWSMENELIPDADPQYYGGVVKQLHELAKQLDPTRLTTVASRGNYDGAALMNTATDVIGYNVYKGWYEAMPEDFAAYADDMHRRFPERAMAISEYGAGAGTTQHELSPGKPVPQGHWHPEEWQAHLHEIIWRAMAKRPFLWGTFVWNMFDFASDGRAEGEQPGRNDKGLMTYDRKIRKDAFYFYKSEWNPQPMVHITSKRFDPRPAGKTSFKVYSNLPDVRISIDGKALTAAASDGNIFTWTDVDVSPGVHAVVAKAGDGKASIVDRCTWTFVKEQQ